MTNEPSPGEIMQRLDAVAAQLAALARQLSEDRNKAEATYIRRDVYMAERQFDQAVVADLAGDIRVVREDRKVDIGWRRQASLTIAVLAISSLVSIALAVINLR